MKQLSNRPPGGPDVPPRTDWHTAFYQAMEMELADYRDALGFHSQFGLTAEPLRIDYVVIKKAKDAVIKKNIAAIFKEWNIFEYKNPGDYVSVADFYKVYAYACLCTSSDKVYEKVPITSMTISFVESRHSYKLLEHLQKDRGYSVAETAEGIYTISGDVMPIQIIESRKLPAEENIWLKSLRGGLNRVEMDQIWTEITRQDKDAQIAVYLHVLAEENPEILQEAFMRDRLTFEQLLEKTGLTTEWEARGRAEGEARGRTEGRTEEAFSIAQNLINLGLPFETVVSATHLEPEKVKALYQGRI
jgi:hypothetical protein